MSTKRFIKSVIAASKDEQAPCAYARGCPSARASACRRALGQAPKRAAVATAK